MQFLLAGLAASVKAERLVSTHLSFRSGVMFEAGRLHTLLGPPSGIELIVHQPMVGRFSAGCICPDSSVLTDYSSRLGHRCRHVRVHTDHNLLW